MYKDYYMQQILYIADTSTVVVLFTYIIVHNIPIILFNLLQSKSCTHSTSCMIPHLHKQGIPPYHINTKSVLHVHTHESLLYVISFKQNT